MGKKKLTLKQLKTRLAILTKKTQAELTKSRKKTN